MVAPGLVHSHASPREPESRLVGLFRVLPLFGVVMAVYLGLALAGVDLAARVFGVEMISTATLVVTGNDLFLAGVVCLLFFELLKASNATHRLVFVEHFLSTFVFVAFVVLFLLHPACGNATFLTIALLSLVDVLAGWTITYRGGLRDWAAG
jgi:hypothetical protein